MGLFGIRSTLRIYKDSDDGDTQPESAVIGSALNKLPEFFRKVWVGCGYSIAFHPLGYGSAPVLEFDDDGHALFSMNSACATIMHRVCASYNN